ncbi:MAG: hybrid sensor histidine kinase/response regulator [Afipia sp.]
MQAWQILSVSAVYIGVLFVVAWWGDHIELSQSRRIEWLRTSAIIYALTLAVYNTTWSFYGSVGRATASGFDFLPIYIGPILILLFGQKLIAKVIRIAKEQNATSIADFISSRYGRSQTLATLLTLAALVGALPYIALQLKAIATSFDAIVLAEPDASEYFISQDTALSVAIFLAVFSIVFGIRHIHAREHHRGLMLAIAFESLVKLAAFVVVGIYIVFEASGGAYSLYQRVLDDPRLASLTHPDFTNPTWISNTIISMVAFLCLPQAFHVAVVENQNPKHVRSAAILYPLYLLVISLFMVPIAMVGLLTFGQSINPDLYMIAIPLASNSQAIALTAFIGGLSAGTGMVIVATVALSTMICNDVVMPIVLRSRAFKFGHPNTDLTKVLIAIRRACAIGVLALAYGTYRFLDKSYPLTSIGLVSFVGVAQFGPAFLGGLYWRRANRAGAVAGLLTGLAVWSYTLLAPIAMTLWKLPGAEIPHWAHPHALFGLGGLDAISHSTLWSLGLNIAVFIFVSLLARQTTVDRARALAFWQGAAADTLAPTTPRSILYMDDLRSLTSRFIGFQEGAGSFDKYLARRLAGYGPPLKPSRLIDSDALHFTETALSGAIGAASARVVMAAALESDRISTRQARDILDEASEALRFSRGLLQGILESLSQGVCAFDSEFRITAWNGRFLEMLELPADFIRVGLSLSEMVSFNTARGEYHDTDLRDLFFYRKAELHALPYQYERIRPDGRVLEIIFARMAGNGYVATYTDVTDRHAAALTLRDANERLEERVQERTLQLEKAKRSADDANASKTRFLAATSHDLMQPMTAARLFIAALQESLARGEIASPEDRGKEAVLAQRALSAFVSTEQLLDELLDISALDTGVVKPDVKSVDVGSILSQLALEFSGTATERGLHFRVLPRTITGLSDPALLRRALQNIISNALRYTPSGGVLVGCRCRLDCIEISVHDTGIGIPENRIHEIFQEFRRLDINPTAERGLGIGLSIVDRIVNLLEHRLEVRSTLGKGTSFTIKLPRSHEAAACPESTDERPSSDDHIPLRVLCLDDDLSIRQGLQALLMRWSYEAFLASDVDQAIAICREREIDAILLDLKLGSSPIDGLAAYDIICAATRHRIPAILVTADRTEAVRRTARQRNILLVQKPIRPAALRKALLASSSRAD